MLTAADIRNFDSRIAPDSAQRIADQWNLAYPHMRAALTAAIAGHRAFLATTEQRFLTEERQAEATQFIKDRQQVRRELGQLDRCVFQQCTRSPGGFSLTAALAALPAVLDAFPYGAAHLGDVYRLAAVLADVTHEQHTARKAAQAAAGYPV